MARIETRGNAKAKASITRHPLFPAMVALWCAALLSLGSLAIGTVALENLVLALRVDLVLPIAAPPLGIKARILLALALFFVGAISGYMLARRIARPRDVVAPRSFRQMDAADAPYEDGEDFARLDAATNNQNANAIPGRRRALAMEEDYALEFHEHMPLPGGAPQILDLAELGAFTEITDGDDGEVEQEAVAAAIAVEPAETNHVYDPWNRHSLPIPTQAHQPVPPSTIAFTPSAALVDEARPFAAPSANLIGVYAQGTDESEPYSQPAPTQFASPFAQPEAITSETGAFETGEPQLVYAASALRAFATPAPQTFKPETEVAAAPLAAAPESEPVVAVLGLVPSDAAEKLMTAPIASLGVVELAERLALAISRRRGSAHAAPVAEIAPAAPEPGQHFAVPSAFAPPTEGAAIEPPATPFSAPIEQAPPPRFAVPLAFAAPAPAAPANPISEMASPLSSAQPTAMPSAMRPLSFDDQDDEESLDSVLPPSLFGRPGQPVPAAVQGFPPQPPIAETEPAQTEAPDGADEESFGSLLGMKPTLRETFVRVEEPVDEQAPVEPVVIFPGQSGHTPFNNGTSVRRFDSPGAMAAGTASAMPAPVNPEETERALKAALATLQRMSGAA